MPYLNYNTFVTRIRRTREAQDLLCLIAENPWLVHKCFIHDGMVKFQLEGMSFPLIAGQLSKKYAHEPEKKLYVQHFQVTGGEPMPQYVSSWGTRLKYFGLNLRILVLGKTPEPEDADPGEDEAMIATAERAIASTILC